MNTHENLIALLKEIDGFRPAPYRAGVSDIPKGAKYPYKFVLIQSLCSGVESGLNRLAAGELTIDEILPIYAKCLQYLPSDFAEIRHKKDEMAQPMSRLARDGFWPCYDIDGKEIDFKNFTTNQINNIKKVVQLEKLNFSHCKLSTRLATALATPLSRSVVSAFASLKIGDCLPN